MMMIEKFPIQQETALKVTTLQQQTQQQQQQQYRQQRSSSRHQPNRDSFDISARILEVIMHHNIDGVMVSRIKYKVQISTKYLKKYLQKLCCSGLIEIKVIRRKLVRLTEKGVRFLQLYQKIQDMLLSSPSSSSSSSSSYR